MKNKTVAIVGATGAVGREFLGCIEARGVPVKSLKLLASARSAGQTQRFRGQALTVQPVDNSVKALVGQQAKGMGNVAGTVSGAASAGALVG